MRILILITAMFLGCTLNAQRDWSGPTGGEPLPKKLQGLERNIDVIHFPKQNDPIKIDNAYYWKHMTSILCKQSDIIITEYGAYLFYNGKWNLRKSYPLKELDKTFGTKKQKMKQAEPYTWAKNWRVDTNLFGGWAMWYFIGTDSNGKAVCGYETINTTNNLLNK
ncbi:hypothetical protein [Spongiivirga citrea]|uniref:Uncharacterized protein n=1 Tax=Spongiivirga citrea TaxID=1481457 RepID=A0A6M0CRN7_9FLAO|nr:hypothetical protein [Spongiivirga citrea]NER18187.1 hypothetical protein [Spongiivirga citrea]